MEYQLDLSSIVQQTAFIEMTNPSLSSLFIELIATSNSEPLVILPNWLDTANSRPMDRRIGANAKTSIQLKRKWRLLSGKKTMATSSTLQLYNRSSSFSSLSSSTSSYSSSSSLLSSSSVMSSASFQSTEICREMSIWRVTNSPDLACIQNKNSIVLNIIIFKIEINCFSKKKKRDLL